MLGVFCSQTPTGPALASGGQTRPSSRRGLSSRSPRQAPLSQEASALSQTPAVSRGPFFSQTGPCSRSHRPWHVPIDHGGPCLPWIPLILMDIYMMG